jgi:hypothetical protein
VKHDGSRPVPLHLRNAPTKLMKTLGYGHAYRYAHDEPEAYAAGEQEGMVLGGLWAMLASPVLFLGLLAVFLVIAGFILFKLWGLLGRLLRRV